MPPSTPIKHNNYVKGPRGLQDVESWDLGSFDEEPQDDTDGCLCDPQAFCESRDDRLLLESFFKMNQDIVRYRSFVNILIKTKQNESNRFTFQNEQT